ncbi:MAG: hypothetical protein K1W27_06825 [Lachnospiraceae bacterium]
MAAQPEKTLLPRVVMPLFHVTVLRFLQLEKTLFSIEVTLLGSVIFFMLVL